MESFGNISSSARGDARNNEHSWAEPDVSGVEVATPAVGVDPGRVPRVQDQLLAGERDVHDGQARPHQERKRYGEYLYSGVKVTPLVTRCLSKFDFE